MDPPARNGAMVEKLRLPFPLLSDPEGKVIQAYGVWDEQSRISMPAILIVSSSGKLAWQYTGQDFADRPPDSDLFAALDAIGDEDAVPTGVEIRVTAEEAEAAAHAARSAISLQDLAVYYRGGFYTTVAMKRRMADLPNGREAVREIGRYQQMVEDHSQAVKQTLESEA